MPPCNAQFQGPLVLSVRWSHNIHPAVTLTYSERLHAPGSTTTLGTSQINLVHQHAHFRGNSFHPVKLRQIHLGRPQYGIKRHTLFSFSHAIIIAGFPIHLFKRQFSIPLHRKEQFIDSPPCCRTGQANNIPPQNPSKTKKQVPDPDYTASPSIYLHTPRIPEQPTLPVPAHVAIPSR